MSNLPAKGDGQSSLCRASHCLGVISSSLRKAVRKACASGKPHRAATSSSPRTPAARRSCARASLMRLSHSPRLPPVRARM